MNFQGDRHMDMEIAMLVFGKDCHWSIEHGTPFYQLSDASYVAVPGYTFAMQYAWLVVNEMRERHGYRLNLKQLQDNRWRASFMYATDTDEHGLHEAITPELAIGYAAIRIAMDQWASDEH